MQLCSYTVVHDTGFAPNPFGGFCTLAACTPNHQGVRLVRGDWLMGHSTARTGHKLIYAMRISEVLDFDEYYRDRRFASKKPRFDRGWEDACGDNIYYRGDDGSWAQHESRFHSEPEKIRKDVKHPRVFISDHFFYFGEGAPEIPEEFRDLVRNRQGAKCSHPRPLSLAFIRWLESKYEPGRLSNPRDLDWTREVPACAAERVVPGCAPASAAPSGCSVAEVLSSAGSTRGCEPPGKQFG